LTDVAPLPRGRHRLSRQEVYESQRGRMLDALAEAVAAKGYAATTIADIVGRAGVSRTTFYEHFADKEACYLAAYDLGISVLLEEMGMAVAEQELSWARLKGAVRAFLRVLSEEPAYARAFLVEVLGSFPAAVERRNEVYRMFAEFFGAMYDAAPDWPGKPPLDRELQFAFTAAMAELVAGWVYQGRTDELADLEPTILTLCARLTGLPPDYDGEFDTLAP
jgi:AcrR family transcriptional regulator